MLFLLPIGPTTYIDEYMQRFVQFVQCRLNLQGRVKEINHVLVCHMRIVDRVDIVAMFIEGLSEIFIGCSTWKTNS